MAATAAEPEFPTQGTEMTQPSRRRASLSIVPAAVLVSAALCRPVPAAAQAEPIPAQAAQPDLVKLLPPQAAASKTFTLAVALGSPPDDFRDAKGERLLSGSGVVVWMVPLAGI